ncbi:hypothetical protein STCU_01589 [Strigomonas culicis]|uniref:SAM domain-containing protein n=1 Tax=Strigomonas culicis TaxID=28005 RepID=S9V082_9TRYP|nr:hypothetical protein STCU_01589 [Strigomonas culicis]|eukprot:EPY34428.1 hypothetical protein STCU_01589 [Strigomonas culicis]
MKHRHHLFAFVATCVLLALVLSVPAAVRADEKTAAAPPPSVPLSAKPVVDWTAEDVAEWMSTVVGYAEYTPYLFKNLIDGVTLLEMEPSDFESYLPLQTPLHAIKIAAHLRLLKGLCSCRGADADAAGPHDLWSYMRAHPVRTWLLGSTASYFPRIALVAAYVFDREVYHALVLVDRSAASALSEAAQGPDVPLQQVSYLAAAGYWLGGLVCPDLYLAYQSARFVGRNYVAMPLQVIHFLSRALGEVLILFLLYKKQAFPTGTPLWRKVWLIHSYSLFIPPVCALIGYVLPMTLQYIFAAVFIAHNLFYLVPDALSQQLGAGAAHDGQSAAGAGEGTTGGGGAGAGIHEAGRCAAGGGTQRGE